MSKLEVTELGRKWYGISVSFDNTDIDRVNPDVLRGLGGKLRYDEDGGLRALFHFNVTKRDNTESMLKVLKYFGTDGYFHKGMNITPAAARRVDESDSAIESVVTKIKTSCNRWSEQWKDTIRTAINHKTPRVKLLRKIRELGIHHISEDSIRCYTEDLLRQKYESELFVETFMWRLGWPDKRKPFMVNSHKEVLTNVI